MTGSVTGGVFLSYRREETSHLAGRLADRLTDRFGAARIFMDVDSIEPGLDFAETLQRAIDRSDVLLALIGPQWLSIVDQHGRPRLADPEDFVALEVRTALARETTRVIPVLVDGAAMPTADDLPTSLSPLARRHAVRLDHETFHSDVTGLLDRISALLDPTESAAEDVAAPVIPEPGRRRWTSTRQLVGVGTVVLLILASLFAYRLIEPNGGGDSANGSPAACGAAADDFGGEAIHPGWEIHNDATILLEDDRLEITADDGADVRGDLQGAVTAPWLSRGVTGSFSIAASVTVDPRFTYQGAGLLLYRDGDNYVRLERGFGNTDAIVFEYAEDGRHQKVHGPFDGENVVATTATSVELRLERRQTSVTAAWRPIGSGSWQELSGAASLDGDAQVGITVLNRSQPPNGDPARQPLTASFDVVVIACLAIE